MTDQSSPLTPTRLLAWFHDIDEICEHDGDDPRSWPCSVLTSHFIAAFDLDAARAGVRDHAPDCASMVSPDHACDCRAGVRDPEEPRRRTEYDVLASRGFIMEEDDPAPDSTTALDVDGVLRITRSHVLPIGDNVDYSRGYEAARQSIEADLLAALDSKAPREAEG